jgi:hypothetical protein
MRLHSSRDMSSNMGHIVIAENTILTVNMKRLYTFKPQEQKQIIQQTIVRY